LVFGFAYESGFLNCAVDFININKLIQLKMKLILICTLVALVSLIYVCEAKKVKKETVEKRTKSVVHEKKTVDENEATENKETKSIGQEKKKKLTKIPKKVTRIKKLERNKNQPKQQTTKNLKLSRQKRNPKLLSTNLNRKKR